MAEVKLEKVTKVFPGDVKAVDGISLHIADQEFVVLVGPSGCGKSTTLRMVAGLEEVTDGQIWIGGRMVIDVPPKDRDIAMVFQSYALYPHMTVYKNMAFGLKLRRVPKQEIDDRVRHAARILGIEELLNRRPKALSGGQRQRVAVGRAIVRDPACFLFDEPLSNLDAKLRLETRAELKRLHRRLRTTTIYVTHDQEEAMTLGDRVVVMSEGRIQQCGAPLEVFRHPSNRFVAEFVGTPPMNLLDGRLVSENGDAFFEGGGVRLALGQSLGQTVQGSSNSQVVLGLRPECLFLRTHERHGTAFQDIKVDVDIVEPLGNTMDLYMTTSGGARLVARVNAETFEQNASTKIFVDSEQIHLFEPGAYGRRLDCSNGQVV